MRIDQHSDTGATGVRWSLQSRDLSCTVLVKTLALQFVVEKFATPMTPGCSVIRCKSAKKAFGQFKPLLRLAQGDNPGSQELISYIPTASARPASLGTQDVYCAQYPLAAGMPCHSNTICDQPPVRGRSSVQEGRVPRVYAPVSLHGTASRAGRPIGRPCPLPHEVRQVQFV
jgi:hypothetical protein